MSDENDHEKQIERLTKQLAQLHEDNSSLKLQLKNRDTEMEGLRILVRQLVTTG